MITDLPNNVDLKIKPHPRDNRGVYSEICNQFPFVSVTDCDSTEAIIQSDAVLGMSSTLLLEAALLNKPIQSIQINLKMKSPFILDQIGKIKSILNEENLKRGLTLLLENKANSKFLANLPCNKDAMQNILSFINKGLNP